MLRRIRVVIPAATDRWDRLFGEELAKYADPDTNIEIRHLTRGAESIEDAFDEVWSALPTVREVVSAEEDGCAGAIIYCYSDPGLHAAKIAVSIPVVGLGEASAHLASLLGPRFGVLTVGPPESNGWQVDIDKLRVYGLDEKCVGFETIDTAIEGLRERDESFTPRVDRACEKLLDRGATVFVLGCGALLSVDDRISEKFNVPVVVPAAAAIKLCEALVALGLTQSKRAYPPPGEKVRVD